MAVYQYLYFRGARTFGECELLFTWYVMGTPVIFQYIKYNYDMDCTDLLKDVQINEWTDIYISQHKKCDANNTNTSKSVLFSQSSFVVVLHSWAK